MKKKIFTLSAMIGFAYSSFAVCADCKACSGSYYICDSNASQFDQDLFNNCGPGTSIQIEYLEGC